MGREQLVTNHQSDPSSSPAVALSIWLKSFCCGSENTKVSVLQSIAQFFSYHYSAPSSSEDTTYHRSDHNSHPVVIYGNTRVLNAALEGVEKDDYSRKPSAAVYLCPIKTHFTIPPWATQLPLRSSNLPISTIGNALMKLLGTPTVVQVLLLFGVLRFDRNEPTTATTTTTSTKSPSSSSSSSSSAAASSGADTTASTAVDRLSLALIDILLSYVRASWDHPKGGEHSRDRASANANGKDIDEDENNIEGWATLLPLLKLVQWRYATTASTPSSRGSTQANTTTSPAGVTPKKDASSSGVALPASIALFVQHLEEHCAALSQQQQPPPQQRQQPPRARTAGVDAALDAYGCSLTLGLFSSVASVRAANALRWRYELTGLAAPAEGVLPMTRLSVPSADSDLSRRPSADIIDITESGDELDAMVAGLDPFSSDEMHVVLSSLTSVAAVTLGGGGGSNEPLRRGDGSKGDASKGGVSKECMSKGGVSTPLAEEEEEGSAVADSRGMVTTHTDLRRMAEMALRDVHMNNKDAQTISPAVVMAPSSSSSSSSSSNVDMGGINSTTTTTTTTTATTRLTRSDGVVRCSALQQLRRALLHDHMGHLLATADPAWCVCRGHIPDQLTRFIYHVNSTYQYTLLTCPVIHHINTPYQHILSRYLLSPPLSTHPLTPSPPLTPPTSPINTSSHPPPLSPPSPLSYRQVCHDGASSVGVVSHRRAGRSSLCRGGKRRGWSVRGRCQSGHRR